MKVIFLDVDGVLHPLFGGDFFNAKCMNCLKKIVESTGAVIVLSSSWRISPVTIKKVNFHLQQYGIPMILDKTPQFGFCSRPREINHWLASHPEVTHFAVLDDMDMSSEPTFKDHFVHTMSNVGLTEAHVEKAIRFLGGASLSSSTTAAQPGSNSPSAPITKTLGSSPTADAGKSTTGSPSLKPNAGGSGGVTSMAPRSLASVLVNTVCTAALEKELVAQQQKQDSLRSIAAAYQD